VYTNTDNVNLLEVFKAMKDAGKDMPDTKDNKALKAYFLEVYADIDMERVYASDLKKMVKWYQLLEKAEVDIDKATEEANEAAAADEAEESEETEEEAKA
jgi:hypothetical protein